jgi:hypothetical protein
MRRSGSNWLSLAIQQDVLFLPGVENACATQAELACFSGGAPYAAGEPYMLEVGRDDRVTAGPALATTRVLLGFDRNVTDNVSVGARIGYAFGGGPARVKGPSFSPIHLEARAAYWFGSRPFLSSRFRPYAVVGAGRAQIDAKRTVVVQNQDPQPNGMPLPAQDRQVTLDAWRKTGTTFVAGGVGVAYALSRGASGTGELKVHEMFGTPGTAVSLQLGCSVGF